MAEKNFSLTPRLIKQENGLDYFTYFPGESAYAVYAMPLPKTIQVARALRTINDLSKQTLPNGQVYVHGDLSPMNAVFKGDQLVGIIDWDSTHIGQDYEDFIYLAWTWLNIGDPARNNAQILEDLITLLKAYDADDAFKKDFAKKMTNVMDERLKATPKDSRTYERIYQWVGWSKIWVDLYRDRITKRIG
jgi:aminoglycoside phosphotransferase (APT) family kinase protein